MCPILFLIVRTIQSKINCDHWVQVERTVIVIPAKLSVVYLPPADLEPKIYYRKHDAYEPVTPNWIDGYATDDLIHFYRETKCIFQSVYSSLFLMTLAADNV